MCSLAEEEVHMRSEACAAKIPRISHGHSSSKYLPETACCIPQGPYQWADATMLGHGHSSSKYLPETACCIPQGPYQWADATMLGHLAISLAEQPVPQLCSKMCLYKFCLDEKRCMLRLHLECRVELEAATAAV